jgi:hypothetical protein
MAADVLFFTICFLSYVEPVSKVPGHPAGQPPPTWTSEQFPWLWFWLHANRRHGFFPYRLSVCLDIRDGPQWRLFDQGKPFVGIIEGLGISRITHLRPPNPEWPGVPVSA